MLLVLLALISTVNGGQVIAGTENAFDSKPADVVEVMRRPMTRYRNVPHVIERRQKTQNRNVPQVVLVNPEINYIVKVNKNPTITSKNIERHEYNMQAQEPRDPMRISTRRRNEVITDTSRKESLRSPTNEETEEVVTDTSREGSFGNPMKSLMKTKTKYGRGRTSTKRPQKSKTSMKRPQKSKTSKKRPQKSKTSSTRKTRSRSRSRNSGTTPRSPVLSSALSTGKVVYDVWIAFGRREYMVKRDAKSFDDAEASCKKLGAHLVSIHSEAENNFIHKITSTGSKIKSFNEFVYTGLRLNSKNEWKWTDESGFNYKNWAKHQPDLSNREKCVQFHQDPANLVYVKEYQWNSISCDLKMKYYVCKRNLQKK